MPTTVIIRDETKPGTRGEPFPLELLQERLTLRELIRERVYQEVKDFNANQAQVFRGLVQPSGAEQERNGWRVATSRAIDWKEQFEAALEAFAHNGFLVLVDDRQVDDLDAELTVSPSTEVTFLKLLPLVGG